MLESKGFNSNKVSISEYTGEELTKLNEEETFKMRSWNFNVLEIPSLHDKFRVVYAMFCDANLFDLLKIESSLFATFLHNLSLYYGRHTNPFHNFDHGITGTNSFK